MLTGTRAIGVKLVLSETRAAAVDDGVIWNAHAGGG
jgi:hypothetical protein